MRRVLLSVSALAVITATVPMAESSSALPAPNSEFTIATGAVNTKATLAVAEDGTAHVAWTVADQDKYRVRYCRVPRGTRACAGTPLEFGVNTNGNRMVGPPDVFVRGNDVSILSPAGFDSDAHEERVALVQSHDGGLTFGAREVVGNSTYSAAGRVGQAPDGSFWKVGAAVQRTQAGAFADKAGKVAGGMAIEGDVVFDSDGTAFATYQGSNGDAKVYRLATGTDPNVTQQWELAYDTPNVGVNLSSGPLGVLLRTKVASPTQYNSQFQIWNGSSFSDPVVVPIAGGGNLGPTWQDAGRHLYVNYGKMLIVSTATSFKVLLRTERSDYEFGDTAADGGGFMLVTDGGSVILLPIPVTRRVTGAKITKDVFKAVVGNGHKGQLVRLEIKTSGGWKQVAKAKVGANHAVAIRLAKSGKYRVTGPVIEGYSGFKSGSKRFKA